MTSAIRARREAEDGFTLIELLVVVIIIGILAAIAIPAFLNQRERAWQAELSSTVRNVALEVEAEATIFGGDYTDVVGDGTANFQTFVQEQLTALQSGADDPVVFDETSTDYYNATSTAFSICMEHTQIAFGSVEYDSASGGLQDYAEATCAGAVS